MLKIFMTQGRKLLIYLIVTQRLDLKPFTNQNKMRLGEKDKLFIHCINQKKLLKKYTTI